MVVQGVGKGHFLKFKSKNSEQGRKNQSQCWQSLKKKKYTAEEDVSMTTQILVPASFLTSYGCGLNANCFLSLGPAKTS